MGAQPEYQAGDENTSFEYEERKNTRRRTTASGVSMIRNEVQQPPVAAAWDSSSRVLQGYDRSTYIHRILIGLEPSGTHILLL